MSIHHSRRCGWLTLVAPGALAAVALVLTAGSAGAQTANGNRGIAVGSVTSVHGTSVQVSNTTQNSESTVMLQPTTQYSKRETATASALTVGACVRVLGTGSATKGITARTVAVTPSTANGCNGPALGRVGAAAGAGGGFRFGNGQRPRNFGNRTGTGAPNRRRLANLAIASGPVVSVHGDSVVVKSTTFVRPSASSSSSSSAKKKTTTTTAPKAKRAATTDVTVILTSSSQITQTVAAGATDVAVGSCVTATGTSSGGGVDAARVAISEPVNGECLGGFGGFGRFGGGGPASGAGSGGPSGSSGQI
jgi:hypothetical protein